MPFTPSTLLKSRSRVVFGLLRFFILSLLIAVFGFTSLHAQVVAYVTNFNLPPSVSVINTASPDQGALSTIPVGFDPSGIVFSPDGTRVYVASSGISVINTASNTVVATIHLPTGPAFFLAISPDGKHLYADDGCCRVHVVDTATNTVSTTIFVAGANGPIAVTPDGSQVYVDSAGNSFGSTVSVIDTASNTVVANQIPVVFISSFSGGLVFTPDGGHAYVGGVGITVIDTSNHGTTTIPLPFSVSARSLAITPDGSKVFFTTFSFTPGVPSTFGVIRTADNTIVQQLSFPAHAPLGFGSQVAITPDGAFAWVVDSNESLIWIISTADLSVVDKVPVSHPFTIAISSVSPPPTAVAGPNQTVHAGQTVHLDGSGSFAPNTLPANLKYAWSFISRPVGSAAVLTGANTGTPSFVADAPGDFVVQLIVTDPATLLSRPSRLTVSSLWSPPMADPGPSRSAVAGEVVQLNGGGSTDPNGLPLIAYSWSFVAQPDGSAAVITQLDNGLASFIPDLAGSYIVGLTVSDAFGSSPQATVAISVITRDDFAQQRIHDAINYIAAMPCSHFDACGHRNALSNHLQQAISDIQNANIPQATGKLNDAILRTDGFPLRGALDGDGPGMDWITDANDQTFVFSALTDAINALTAAPI